MTSIATPRRPKPLSPRGDPVCRRARAGGQRRDFDGRQFVLAQRHPSHRHHERLRPLADFCDGPAAGAGPRLHDARSQVLRRTRNSQGILIGTARTNPGRDVSHPAHLADPERVAPLENGVSRRLRSLEVDALVSIGGDDTLKTANKFKLFQDRLPDGATADSRRARAQDDRQRLLGHRLHVRLFHGRRTRWPAKSATCWPTPKRAAPTT